jgi:hypothetical protein
MFGHIFVDKYVELGNPISTYINGMCVPNTLINLGITINFMTIQTNEQLNFPNLHPTHTILELADRSKKKWKGVLDDVIVSLDSWEYPVEFMVLQPKSPSGKHLIILGRPWLAIVDAFIDCRSRNMFISHGDSTKQVTLYPPTKPLTELENIMCYDNANNEDKFVQLVFIVDQVMNLKGDTEENQINTFLCNSNLT